MIRKLGRNSARTITHRLSALTLAVASLSLLGCAGPNVSDYANETPVLDLRTYFNGKVTAHGIFTDRSGQVIKRFAVNMNCTWQGDVGTLDETFSYSDGSTQHRVWVIKRTTDGRYTGMATDVVGEASGRAAGNAFNWHYTLALPVDGTVWNVQFDDWMYLMDEHTMLNKAVMSKFGVRLGEITLSFNKH